MRRGRWSRGYEKCGSGSCGGRRPGTASRASLSWNKFDLRMKVLLVHPGTQYSFQLARQLDRLGCLGRFWTGMAFVPNSFAGRCIECLPTAVGRHFANRRLDGVASEKLRVQPLIEWGAVRRLRAGEDDQAVIFR